MNIWADRWCQLFGYADCRDLSGTDALIVGGGTIAVCAVALAIVAAFIAVVRP